LGADRGYRLSSYSEEEIAKQKESDYNKFDFYEKAENRESCQDAVIVKG